MDIKTHIHEHMEGHLAKALGVRIKPSALIGLKFMFTTLVEIPQDEETEAFSNEKLLREEYEETRGAPDHFLWEFKGGRPFVLIGTITGLSFDDLQDGSCETRLYVTPTDTSLGRIFHLVIGATGTEPGMAEICLAPGTADVYTFTSEQLGTNLSGEFELV